MTARVGLPDMTLMIAASWPSRSRFRPKVWRNSLDDLPGAVRLYRNALALGATEPLPEIYAAAGAQLVFDEARMEELVALVMREVESLWRDLPDPPVPTARLR